MDAAAERDFRDFVAARSGALLASAYLLTGQREAAEDLLQTVLIRAADRWGRIEHPESYVRRALYHQQVTRWRRHGTARERLTDDVPEPAGRPDPADRTDDRVALVAALRQLTPRQRAVVVLRYFEDLPESEVAALLGLKLGTVRSLCHRALARLRVTCPDLAPGDDFRKARS